AALRPDRVSAEVEQLGVVGDEYQVLVAGGQVDGTDHLVALPERDDLELVPVGGVVGVDPLHHARTRTQRQAGTLRGQGRECQGQRSCRQLDERRQRRATGEVGGTVRRGQRG